MTTSCSNALLDISENDLPTLSDANKLDLFNEQKLSNKSSIKISKSKKKNNSKSNKDDN